MNRKQLKRIMIVGCLLLGLMLSFPVLQSTDGTGTQLVIQVSQDTVEAGDVFFVTISMNQSEPVAGVQVDLSFDPLLVQVESVSNANPGVWSFFGPPIINNTIGMITGAGVAALGTTVFTPTDCFTISFITLDGNGVVTLSPQNIIILNETADQISPVFTAEKIITVGSGVEDDSPSQDPGSSGQSPGSSPVDDSSNQNADSPGEDDSQEPFPDNNHTQLTADFRFTPLSPTVGEDIIFHIDIGENEEEITRVHWDFGDGHDSTDTNPIHQYLTSGTYQVTLTLWDTADFTVTQSKNITIEPVQQDTDEPINDEESTTEETPGYELFFIFTSVIIVLIVKIKKLNDKK